MHDFSRDLLSEQRLPLQAIFIKTKHIALQVYCKQVYKDRNYLMTFMTIYTQKICKNSWNTYTYHFLLSLRGHFASALFTGAQTAAALLQTDFRRLKNYQGAHVRKLNSDPQPLIPINANFLSKCSDSDMPSPCALGLPDKSTNFAQSLFEKGEAKKNS